MNPRIIVPALLACAIASVFSAGLVIAVDSKVTAEVKNQTVITIDGMHCAGCAKSVAKKLEAVKYVTSVKIDAKTGMATIVPAKDKSVSPKSLWEAVEAAKYAPTKLVSPSGTFTKKPKS